MRAFGDGDGAGTSVTELVAPPARGRTFTSTVRAGLADCAPSGRVRLDALARWLQDVAYADVEQAGLAQSAVWVLRRSRMRVARFPRFGEQHELLTFCSGFGRMWAERSTTVGRMGAPTADVETVSLWVHLDPLTLRPAPLNEQELATYGDAAAGRRVTARLRHPPPGETAERGSWRFRATELDVAGHINNAAYWRPLEERLLSGEDPPHLDVEMEFRSPAQPGEKLVLSDGERLCILDPSGELHSSTVVLSRELP
jgi:acyl-ACP thioesterase